MEPQSTSEVASCPYCGTVLGRAPRRKAKCPDCGHHIAVRGGALVTEGEAAIGDWLLRVQSLGITRKDFDRHRQQLSKQFGFMAPMVDTAWRVLNSLITSGRDHTDLKSVYPEMAHLADLEGKDAKPFVSLAGKHELLQMKLDGVLRVRVDTCNDDLVCPACRAMATRTYRIDEALATLPVPNACRREEGCRCWYG